jgi:hypothetical protein
MNDLDDRDEIPAEVARLRDAIACELHAQLGLRCDTIQLEDVPGAAYAIAVRLAYTFRIEWAPPWAEDGEDDESLGPDGATFHGTALPTGSHERYPIFDHDWPARRIAR